VPEPSEVLSDSALNVELPILELPNVMVQIAVTLNDSVLILETQNVKVVHRCLAATVVLVHCVVRYAVLHFAVAHCVAAVLHYVVVVPHFAVALRFFGAELPHEKEERYVEVVRKTASTTATHCVVRVVQVPFSPDCALVYHPIQNRRVAQFASVAHRLMMLAVVQDATHLDRCFLLDSHHPCLMTPVEHVLVALRHQLVESQLRHLLLSYQQLEPMVERLVRSERDCDEALHPLELPVYVSQHQLRVE